jgi:antitoxin component of MazEF toxin-antitoxin module
MRKRLIRTGNSLALVLDRPFLEAANIDARTPLEVSSDGDVIVIAPVRGRRRAAQLEAAAEEINREFAGVFRRLAE